MATRKKTPKIKKAELKEAPVVTHVVEIVDEASGETKPLPETIEKEEVKEVVDELKEEVGDVEEKVEELEEKVEPEDKATPTPTEKPKEKEVLEEIFGNHDKGVMPEISGRSGVGGKSLFVWALIVVGVAILTGLGLLVAVRGPESITSIFTNPTPTPTSTPIPTPTPALPARADIRIEVLNGSGIAGAAAKMQEYLEGMGYDVGRAGNADMTGYKETEIHVKADKKQYLSLLQDDIAQGYTVGTAAADLSAGSDYDAQVIVGIE
ncbi:LytR C-terminal domain-containing protein [Candidatus Gottesmanbacteria bacterium]|nr:LytR C-terminal domain-containing protein [Candidatus Gottesmanbacteria bacterium]